MPVTVTLTWKFEPENYFEGIIETNHAGWQVIIDKGEVKATIETSTYNKDPSIEAKLQQTIENRFRAIQVLTHTSYELSEPNIVHINAEEKKGVTIRCKTAHIAITGGQIDLKLVDKDGNIKVDTKKDRTEKKKLFSKIVSAAGNQDPLLNALLKSYNNAVKDPQNELVHLYEIADALKKYYKGITSAQRALGISSTKWSKFTHLCNNASLLQGRHRGEGMGIWRDATHAELNRAREIARQIIEAYVTAIQVP